MEEPESRACSETKEPEFREVEIGGDVPTVLPMYDAFDDDVDFDPAEFHIEEGMVAEVMRRLEEEINQPCGGEGGCGFFTPRPHHFHHYQVVPSRPSSSAVASFVTINGNEESCGPSFSDSASTVMASIDTRGVVGLWPQSIHVSAAGKAAETEEVIWPWFLEPAAEAALEPDCAGATGDGDATADFGVEDMEEVGDDGWLACVLASAGLGVEGEERVGG